MSYGLSLISQHILRRKGQSRLLPGRQGNKIESEGNDNNEKIDFVGILLSVWMSALMPFGMTARAQVIGKAREKKMKSPPGLKFRLSEGVEGAETREKQMLPPPTRFPKQMRKAAQTPPRDKSAGGRPDGLCQAGRHLPAPKTGQRCL